MPTFFDPEKKVFNLDGTPALDQAEGKDWTLGRIVMLALLRAETGIGEEEQLKRFFLAEKFAKAGGLPVKLTDKDTVLIRKQVEKLYTPLFLGRVTQEIDKEDVVGEVLDEKVNGDARVDH